MRGCASSPATGRRRSFFAYNITDEVVQYWGGAAEQVAKGSFSMPRTYGFRVGVRNSDSGGPGRSPAQPVLCASCRFLRGLLLKGVSRLSRIHSGTLDPPPRTLIVEARVSALLGKMTVAEKIGQMSQLNGANGEDSRRAARDDQAAAGSDRYSTRSTSDVVNEMQRIAVEESRLGIPLLIGRDVLHGFRTVLPIPLGLAATFNPELVRRRRPDGGAGSRLPRGSTGPSHR